MGTLPTSTLTRLATGTGADGGQGAAEALPWLLQRRRRRLATCSERRVDNATEGRAGVRGSLADMEGVDAVEFEYCRD